MTNYADLARRWYIQLEPEPVFLVAIESEAGVQTNTHLKRITRCTQRRHTHRTSRAHPQHPIPNMCIAFARETRAI